MTNLDSYKCTTVLNDLINEILLLITHSARLSETAEREFVVGFKMKWITTLHCDYRYLSAVS